MTANKASYTRQDTIRALRDAGLVQGDIVFVTTSLGMLGLPEATSSAHDLNQLHFEALLEVVGADGTIIVPTYSYTFGKSTASEPAIFDPLMTPAQVGPFPEFFRQQPHVTRSLDPMMSVAGIGREAKRLLSGVAPTSYGADSIFARLVHVNAKCCSVGLGPNWMPFIHHADWLAQVPHRYDKLFKGLIKTTHGVTNVTWLYSVPLLHRTSQATAHNISKQAVEAGIWHHAPLGRARVYVASYRAYFDFTLACIKKDPWATADGPPSDPVKVEEERVPRQSFTPLKTVTLDQTLFELAKIPRTEVSDGLAFALRELGRFAPIREHVFQTGENHFDWLIPERWTFRHAKLSTPGGRVIWFDDGRAERTYANGLSHRGEYERGFLGRHVRTDLSHDGARPYWNVLMDRDWGFCATAGEWRDLPNGRYNVDIACDRALGRMKVGEISQLRRDRPLILILAYLNGPTGGTDLTGVYAAIEIMRQLTDSKGREPRWGFATLILPGPAGLAAWLSRFPMELARLAGIVELGTLARSCALPIRIPQHFVEHPLVRAWQTAVPEASYIVRRNEEAHCLQPGENPIADKRLADCGFPVISVGQMLAVESQAHTSPPGTGVHEALALHHVNAAIRASQKIAKTLLCL